MKKLVRDAISPNKYRRLWLMLAIFWVSISLISLFVIPNFWPGRIFALVFLAYGLYYAWSRIVRGVGQVGIAIIEKDSPLFDKIVCDLVVLTLTIVSIAIAVGFLNPPPQSLG